MVELSGCVVRNDEGELLLLHRATHDLTQWELPGGKVEPGETHELAAMRELKEELGIQVEILRKLGSAAFNNSEKEWNYTWFLATILDEQALQIGEPNVFDEYSYWKLSKLKHRQDLSPNLQNLLKSGLLNK